MDEIKAQYLTYEDVSQRASELLMEFGRANNVPVDVEAIVEFDIGLGLKPVRGLQDRFAVDGFLSLDMTEIVVDEGILERHPTRYRFTLAHELGHLILHGDVFTRLKLSGVEEWVAFYRSILDQDYGWLERQAYWFAGAILVPEDLCIAEFRAAMEKVGADGLDVTQLSGHSRTTVAGYIAKQFVVSTGVVTRRLNEIGLW